MAIHDRRGEAMATMMKVAQVPKAGADFEIVERAIPVPGPGQVRIRVQACGVCHSDVLAKEGGWPGLVYPPRATARSGRCDRRSGLRRDAVEERPESRRWVARRSGWDLPRVPARRLRELGQLEGHRPQLRGRLLGGHDCACRSRRVGAGVALTC